MTTRAIAISAGRNSRLFIQMSTAAMASTQLDAHEHGRTHGG